MKYFIVVLDYWREAHINIHILLHRVSPLTFSTFVLAVLSFVSQFSSASRTPAPLPSPPEETATLSSKPGHDPILAQQIVDQERLRPITPTSPPASTSSAASSSKGSAQTRRRASSRPASISGGYQPPLMEVNEDTLPELQPVFSLLNSHSNKLYQEGYFLKLEDQNNRKSRDEDRQSNMLNLC